MLDAPALRAKVRPVARLLIMNGTRFGRLTVIRQAGCRVFPSGQRGPRLRCECACGRQVTVSVGHLRSGHTRSCGCLALEQAATLAGRYQHTHGHRPALGGSLTYNSWHAMRDRCRNPRASAYALYGGRGISVCARWDKFENFLADMGERPGGPKGSVGYHSLDRIDNDGNYEAGNCRWATPSEQRRNQRPKVVA